MYCMVLCHTIRYNTRLYYTIIYYTWGAEILAKLFASGLPPTNLESKRDSPAVLDMVWKCSLSSIELIV